jgi:hypothetical protein
MALRCRRVGAVHSIIRVGWTMPEEVPLSVHLRKDEQWAAAAAPGQSGVPKRRL